MRNPKPKWWLLYSVLPLATALFIAADFLSQTTGWRQLADGAVSLAILGAVALWVRANRVALALSDDPAGARPPLRAWVAYCPPVAPRRSIGTPAQKSVHDIAA
jgi:hypothetical protein